LVHFLPLVRPDEHAAEAEASVVGLVLGLCELLVLFGRLTSQGGRWNGSITILQKGKGRQVDLFLKWRAKSLPEAPPR
jgi:hypothetical protein